MFRILHGKAVPIAAVVFALVAAGAYAYWTNGGSGDGTATTGTNAAITVTQTTTPSGLYPGGSAASLAGQFDNGNSGPVFVHEVDATIASVTGANITVGTPCDAGDYQLNGFPRTVDASVPAGDAQGGWTGGSIQMLNAVTNQDGCKDAVVHVSYTSN